MTPHGSSVDSDVSHRRLLPLVPGLRPLEDGVLFGPYYEGNEATAIYNSGFRPFESPVPFLFVRHGVISDWKFFLDDDVWLRLWAQRYGSDGARVLAEELRRLPWRTPRE